MKVKDKLLLEKLILRTPTPGDGHALSNLISKCPPLEKNSLYCSLLQCTHFAATSVAAVINNRLVGFISAYCPSSDPNTLFVWQIVVDEMVRGRGIAKRMLNWLINRPDCKDALKLDATITLENGASRALFESFARDCDANIIKSILFKSDAHFAGTHDDAYLYRVSPLPNRTDNSPALHLDDMGGILRLSSTKRWLD